MTTFTGTDGPDTLNGTAGGDNIYGFAGDDVLNGNQGEDLVTGAEGDDRLSGGGHDDQVYGQEGNDWIDGGSGDDRLGGGAGDDHIIGGAGSDWVRFFPDAGGVIVDLAAGTATGEGIDTFVGIENAEGGHYDDRLTGDDFANQLEGGQGDDIVSGGLGDDRLDGGDGDDSLSGGDGNDRIYASYFRWDRGVDRIDGGLGDDHVTLGLDDEADGGDGHDTLSIDIANNLAGASLDLGGFWVDGIVDTGAGAARGFERIDLVDLTDGADILVIGGPADRESPWAMGRGGDDSLTGSDSHDALWGDDGNDVLIGLAGADYLVAGLGDDRLEAGEGDDRLTGDHGADVLDGGPGGDWYFYLWFGADSPEYVWSGSNVLPSGDLIVEEAADPGIDRIYFDAAADVADDAFAGVRNVELAELRSAYELQGVQFQFGAEFQAAGIGTVIASADIDASAMTAGIEFLLARSTARPLTVTGGAGDDGFRMDPNGSHAGGADYVLSGGGGFDTFHLDHPLAWFEIAAGEFRLSQFEAVVLDGGADRSERAETYRLTLTDAMMAAGTLFTVDARNIAGGILSAAGADGPEALAWDPRSADILYLDVSQLSGGRAVRLLAGEGADTLAGGLGDDALHGGGGNDTLRGGGGEDAMTGGSGNDLYIVDRTSEAVVELPDEGVDTVRSSANFTLPDHVEHLVLTGGGDVRGAGNGLANAIAGNNGSNRLDGGAAADTMAGGAGHDVYVVNNPADRVIEEGSSGNDTVESAVSYALPVNFEKLILTGSLGYDGRGNAAANAITGNSGRNFLNGGRGDDVLDGGGGDDRLMGNLGKDVLMGGAGDDRFYFNAAPGAANADRILDFSPANDSLWLHRAMFAAVGPAGALAASAFHQGSVASDAGDRILYDAATGSIFHDPDGSGAAAAMLFATVDAGTPLSHADFLIYG